jgi:hypothetical protein
MNRETGVRLVLAVAILAAPLLPVFAVDLGPERQTFADSSQAVDELERLFRDETVSPDPVDREVLVTVKLREAGALSAAGLDVQRRYVQQGTHHVEAYMPLSAVRDLSTDPAVETIRLRDIRGSGGRVTDGAARIGALDLHEQGLTGENVTVGIIDGDFRVSHPELAGHVVAYRSFGTTDDIDHGTAVASVVADTAPGANIHVAAVGDETAAEEYREAVTWLRASGADIIVDAGSYFGNAGADTDALSTIARNASGEALFVTSAGNYGQRHWAAVHGPSERRWVTFQPGAEGNALAGGDVFAGRVRASLQWSPVDVDSAWGDVGPYSRVLHDIWVQDDRAYLAHWDSGTFVLDVSDPAAPEFLGRFGDYTLEELRGWSSSRSQGEYLIPKGNAHYVTTDESGTLAGVGAESWSQDGEGGPSGIDLYDVSDPANAELLSTIHPPGSPSNAYSGGTWTSHNFELANDRLYSSWYQGGVMIHDVSDPRSPERIAWWRNTDDGFWTAQLARSGSHFVATTAAQAGTASNTRLYVFPDEAGEQADPPSEITEPEPPSTSGGTTTTAPGTTTGSAGTTSGDGTTTRPDDVTTTADESNGGSPGLGVVSALAGVGIGAWRLGKRRSGD